MSLRIKIAKNTLIQLIGKLLSASATFLITVIIARSFGPVGFGEFIKIISYVSLFYLIVDFGFNAVYLREEYVHAHPTRPSIPFVSLVATRIIWGIVLIGIALVIAMFLPSDASQTEGFTPLTKLGIVLLLPTIITQGIYTSYNALFQKAFRYDKSVIATTIASIATLSIVLIATSINAPLLFVLSGYLVGGVILVFASYLLAKPNVQLTTLNLPLLIAQMRLLFLVSLPLGATLVLNMIYFRTDIFILTLFRTTEEVGIYGLATKAFELPLAFPIFFMNAVYPLLLQTKSTREDDHNFSEGKSYLIKRSLQILALLSVVVVTLGILFAPLLVYIKEEFAASIVPFRILLLGLPFFFISNVLVWGLIAEGKQRVLVWIYGAGMILNIIVNFMFIPLYGVSAAAVTTSVSELFIVLLLWHQWKRRYDRHPD